MNPCRLLFLAPGLALVPPAAAQCELQRLTHMTENLYGAVGPMLGSAVAIDGDRLVAGAPEEGVLSYGAVLIFERSAGTWAESARLFPTTPGYFGGAVDLEGDRVMVGARYQSASGVDAVGAAYVYQRGPVGWTSVVPLLPSDPREYGFFGTSVALAGDTAFVGAPHEYVSLFGPARFIRRMDPDLDSAVYVFERFVTGYWSEKQKLVPSLGGKTRFGASVAADGGTLLVGAPGHPEYWGPTDPYQGSVSVFEPVAGKWVETQILRPPAGSEAQFFGKTVALDGTRAVIGAREAAFTYERGPAGWVHDGELVPREPGSVYFGQSVALGGDVAVVGDFYYEDEVHEAGTAWLFVRTPTGWEERGKLADPSPHEYEHCGYAVAVGADGTAAVGIPGDFVGSGGFPNPRQDQGSVMVWRTSTTGCVTLSGFPERVSLSAGGTQEFALEAPPSFAGDTYLLLASERGTSPGIRFATGLLPLNPGAALTFSLRFPNSPPFGNSLGQLDSSSAASASFTVPPLSDPALIGRVLNFACVTFRGGALPPSGASNAAALEFRP